jgi:hypothetical protein
VRRGLAPDGDRRDALAAAKALRDRSPYDVAAARRVVDAFLALRWEVPAAQEVRAWADRFPTQVAERRAAAAAVREAGGDPGPRTLEAIAAGAR